MKNIWSLKNIKMNQFEISYGFENIAIKQKKNICKSRLDVNIRSEIIKGVFLDVPLIASNMSTVVNSSFCIKLFKNGSLGVMHRTNKNEIIESEIKNIAKECEWVAGSIGIGDEQFELIDILYRAGCNIFFIDVAHGYSDYIISFARKIKSKYTNIKLVVGNTNNVGLLEETYDFIDGIKVGIAQGYACETKNTAGCTEKQFSSVLKFKELSKKHGVPIISDGGTREPADFTKAIAAGANSVMAGMIFSRCPESAGEIIDQDGKKYKLYAGNASRYIQERWRGGLKPGTCSEGGVRLLDLGESSEDLLERYAGALRTGITYAGGNDITSFQNNVEFVLLYGS